MYGSIRKSYGAKKASYDVEKKERKPFFARKNKNEEVVQDEFQETSYMNVENEARNVRSTKTRGFRPIRNNVNNENNANAGKSEFPIASVILTIVFTMMVMVAAFGFGGI